MTTATTLREAAAERYQADLVAIEQAEREQQQAQAKLEALDRQKQEQAERQKRRLAALARLETLTQAHAQIVSALGDEILNWRMSVEQAALVLLQAREAGIKHRQTVMSALASFASDASQCAGDVPEAELLTLVADSALVMADFDLTPRVDARALRNLQPFANWQSWLGHSDGRTETVKKVLNQNQKGK